jgi:hypothetical protein
MEMVLLLKASAALPQAVVEVCKSLLRRCCALDDYQSCMYKSFRCPVANMCMYYHNWSLTLAMSVLSLEAGLFMAVLAKGLQPSTEKWYNSPRSRLVGK